MASGPCTSQMMPLLLGPPTFSGAELWNNHPSLSPMNEGHPGAAAAAAKGQMMMIAAEEEDGPCPVCPRPEQSLPTLLRLATGARWLG
jgi:hypothetical protein